jgi:hypothetical protein
MFTDGEVRRHSRSGSPTSAGASMVAARSVDELAGRPADARLAERLRERRAAELDGPLRREAPGA